MSSLTKQRINQELADQFYENGLLVLPNVFSPHLARAALREQQNPRLFREPLRPNLPNGKLKNLHAHHAPPGTALHTILGFVKRAGEDLDVNFDTKSQRGYIAQALAVIAQSRHLYDLGGTSIAAVAGLSGDLQIGGGWLDTVTHVPPGTIVIARSHHLLPYRIGAGQDQDATGLIIPGDEYL